MSHKTESARTEHKSFRYRTGVSRVAGRSAILSSRGKPPLLISSPPEFGGGRGLWSPEELFVASIEVCLMLTFVGIAEKRGLRFASYESTAEGLLELELQSYRFTRVSVAPVITLDDEPSFAAAREIIERAHRTCLVANSVRCEVIVDPSFQVSR
jgi:organic hydroperoxide reductase OsmC/OhrA